MKQSEIQRKTPMRRTEFKPADPKPAKGPKQVKCQNCRKPSGHTNTMQPWCGIECAHAIALKRLALKKAKEAREDRAKTRAQKELAKDYNELAAEAQKEFNAWIRWRDRDQPCVCCGRTTTGKVGLYGHMWDAGHYRSVGSAPHLRFNEDNVHRQTVFCNKNNAGNHVQYRVMLIERIGLERVEALESNNETMKWSHDELRAIRDKYRKLLRQAKKEFANG